MSINGLMRTSVSGMEAQANRLGGVSANIANASTVGYKSADTQFASLVLDSPSDIMNSGGVETRTRYGISRQGLLSGTSSMYDLAISGAGYLLVEDSAGRVALTRAGAFVPDGEGALVNAAGFKLLGLPASSGGASAIVANGTAGLVPVTISQAGLEAVPTSEGTLVANLPSAAAEVATPDLPSQNAAGSVSSARSSVVVYGQLGEEVTLDVHYARTTTSGEWELAVYDAADRNPLGTFPYTNGPLAQATLLFDATGQLDPSSTTSLGIPIPGGVTMDLDVTGSSQLAAGFSVRAVLTNGNPPNDQVSLEIGTDGVVYETSENGARRAAWQIPLATVVSPDRMRPRSGTIFDPTSESGDMRIGTPGASGLGSLVSGALESSTVDLASELTDMIEAQRNYSANSRVFQTGAELMEVLVNLKR
jgi:flagellar hook protein FlgE